MASAGTTRREVALDEVGNELSVLRLTMPAAVSAMEQSLSRLGQLTPVLVRRTASGGLELIDGFKRVRAARHLGWTHVAGVVIDVDSPGAKLRLLQANASRGLSVLEVAWVVRGLYRSDELTQPQIGLLIGRHKSWVCRRLLLAEGLSPEVETSVRLGLLSATAAQQLARLPRCNQDAVAQVASRRGLTTRQLGRLVDEWLGAQDQAAREGLLARTDAEPSPRAPPANRPRSPGEHVVSDAAYLTRGSVRLSTRLLERSLSSLGEGTAALAAESLSTLAPVLRALCRTIDRSLSRYEEQGHGRPR